jgi:prepilin-type N-terminal cleavage/methylation domain-containing protein
MKISSSSSFVHGFTLIELLMSVAIMTMILGITFSGGPQSIMKLSLADNVSQAELMIREAQLQGSAVSTVRKSDGTDKYGGVGIFLNRSTSTVVLKFRDLIDTSIQNPIGVGNGLYESSPEDEKQDVVTLRNNHKIGKLCVAPSGGALVCNDTVAPPIRTLTISFSRPKQTAHIYINGDKAVDYAMACIQFDSLRSPEKGYVRSLYVYKSGMINRVVNVCS